MRRCIVKIFSVSLDNCFMANENIKFGIFLVLTTTKKPRQSFDVSQRSRFSVSAKGTLREHSYSRKLSAPLTSRNGEKM